MVSHQARCLERPALFSSPVLCAPAGSVPMPPRSGATRIRQTLDYRHTISPQRTVLSRSVHSDLFGLIRVALPPEC